MIHNYLIMLEILLQEGSSRFYIFLVRSGSIVLCGAFSSAYCTNVDYLIMLLQGTPPEN